MEFRIDSNMWFGTLSSREQLAAAVDAVAWAHRHRADAVAYFAKMRRSATGTFGYLWSTGVTLRDCTPAEWWTELEGV